MPHVHALAPLAVLAALVVITTIAVASLAIEAGSELTENQARVLCTAMNALAHLTVGVGSALLGQDTPLTLAVKAVLPLLR
ncbi:hypothetical protein ACFVYG_20335 [Streptomyces sp. NPDC058256]|uniref:hypothetical protein n=1 Tax=Streptomyces sp. NPDC058256 TaxID=3346408 RepID=UPI0036E9BB6C